jgi:hypothetical protein
MRPVVAKRTPRKQNTTKDKTADADAEEVNQIHKDLQISTDLKTIGNSKRVMQISTDLKRGQRI